MPSNLDDLGGVIGEVIGETRAFEDPWNIPGFRITGTVLRADAPAWRQYALEVQAARPEQVRARELVNERIYHGLAPKGFRASKKVSEAEAHAQMLGRMAKSERLLIDVFLLREQKKGLAGILCKSLRVNGESVVTRGGVTCDLDTPEGREAFLSHELWEVTQGGEKKELAIPLYRKNADGATAVDEFGEPVKNDCGGWNLGDAVAQLILQEAEDLPKFVEARKADALEQSADIWTGRSDTGPASPPQDAG